MKEYHKIQTVFLRDPDNKFRTLLEGQFALPEFELLKNIEWNWSEKIDGTNIRVIWDGQKVIFKGKTDKAQIPTFLLKVLKQTFTKGKMNNLFPYPPICLYGEGYGVKIQKGGVYLPDRTDFILFDCKIDNWWLERENLENIADMLSINIVPVIKSGTLLEAIEYCKKGLKSIIAQDKNYIAEGLVMKPKLELFNRNGDRIISKIKFKDFAK